MREMIARNGERGAAKLPPRTTAITPAMEPKIEEAVQ